MWPSSGFDNDILRVKFSTDFQVQFGVWKYRPWDIIDYVVILQ